MELVRSFVRDESGATAIEYALIAGMIALVIITAATSIGANISGVFNKVSGNIT